MFDICAVRQCKNGVNVSTHLHFTFMNPHFTTRWDKIILYYLPRQTFVLDSTHSRHKNVGKKINNKTYVHQSQLSIQEQEPGWKWNTEHQFINTSLSSQHSNEHRPVQTIPCTSLHTPAKGTGTGQWLKTTTTKLLNLKHTLANRIEQTGLGLSQHVERGVGVQSCLYGY